MTMGCFSREIAIPYRTFISNASTEVMLNRAVSAVQLSWAISNVLAVASDIDSPKDTNGNKACADQEVRSIADGI